MADSRGSSKGKYRFTPKFKKIVAWTITVLFSCVFLFAGFKHFSKQIDIFNVEGAFAVRAKVTAIGEYTEEAYDMGDGSEYISGTQHFSAKILGGDYKGQTVDAIQTFDNLTGINEQIVEKGDRVVLYNYGYEQDGTEWMFGGFARFDSMLVFGIIFCALLLVFGRIKGFNTIVSLGFTCLAVFAVFIPSVLAGANIYFWSAVICIYVIIMTLMITEGPTPKALPALLGCAFGVAAAAILTVIYDHVMKLTGMLDEHSIYLATFDPPINLRGIIFAMVVIGAMGAVMDVAMDISASLHELHVKLPDLSLAEFYKSGITIGRDIMGTMANTLVLAYIGSSLCSILLMITYSSSLTELLNRESIVVEIMNGLIGSCAILLTIPLTSLICGILYSNKENYSI
ncbi:MAG: YibE/F family protein [Firmicutes bacterium]|nr:YibE/F family protein [Bacillota bacterium]